MARVNCSTIVGDCALDSLGSWLSSQKRTRGYNSDTEIGFRRRRHSYDMRVEGQSTELHGYHQEGLRHGDACVEEVVNATRQKCA
jgi:hypothetical protein